MNTFKNFHPLTLLCYFLSIFIISIFSFNPIYLIFGFIGAVLYLSFTGNSRITAKSAAGYALMFLIITLTNPLFSHNGATPLFFINDNRITLEALAYGAFFALMITEIIFWFKCFNTVFDSEKTLYIFGRIFPELGLVISISLNFIPKMIRSFKSVYFSTGSLITKQSKVKLSIASFSAVITQSLEDSVQLSDSMKARGYGVKRRTVYSNFSFSIYDLIYLAFFIIMFALTFTGVAHDSTKFEFYPYISLQSPDIFAYISYACFALLSLFPFIFSVKEELKWRFLISKI